MVAIRAPVPGSCRLLHGTVAMTCTPAFRMGCGKVRGPTVGTSSKLLSGVIGMHPIATWYGCHVLQVGSCTVAFSPGSHGWYSALHHIRMGVLACTRSGLVIPKF